VFHQVSDALGKHSSNVNGQQLRNTRETMASIDELTHPLSLNEDAATPLVDKLKKGFLELPGGMTPVLFL